MKPVILTFARHYLPGYRAGGPIRSIANIVERLGVDFDFRIVTQDRDLGDASPYPGIPHDSWMPCGNALVQYVSTNRFGLREVARIIRATPHDLIYLNSFFDPRFTQQVLLNRRLGRIGRGPIVLAPRGEFSAGALRIKRARKHAYIWAAKLFRLYSEITWQASSPFEAEDILRCLAVGTSSGPRGWMAVTGNLVVASDIVNATTEVAEALQIGRSRNGSKGFSVCFLSRVSPKKNLLYALRVLSQVRVPLGFSIYGPIEDAAYWAECQTLIAAMPPHITVQYMGLVDHCDVVSTMAHHDLFFFPTSGENFGHVIHEALRAGLPILISDQTPWRQLREEGVGWDFALDETAAFARKIEEVASWSEGDFNRVARDARALAVRMSIDPAIVEANRKLFHDALKHHAAYAER